MKLRVILIDLTANWWRFYFSESFIVTKSQLSNLFFLLICYLLTSCGGLFYYPDNRLYVDVKKLEIQPQQIELKTTDNKKFFGWYFKASDHPLGKILFFHGNAQNRSSHFYSLYWILKNNYDFFIFDYPGYAESEGTPSQASTTDAGTKALEWLVHTEPTIPFIIFGQSLGGNIALFTAAQNKALVKPCLIAVDSSFKSYRKVAQRVLAKHWLTWPFQGLSYLLVQDSFSADDRITEIAPTPLLVFHSREDPVVAYENGEDIFASALEPKQFFQVPGMGHILSFTGPDHENFRKIFLDALAKNCSQKSN